MDLREVVRRRKMVRSFEARPLPAGTLDRILAAAQRGPSAGFAQGTEYLVFEDGDTERFWAVASPGREFAGRGWPGVYNAAAVVVVLANKNAYLERYAEPDKGWSDRAEARWTVPYWHVDAAFAAMIALLSAVDEGLGALFFGIADWPAVRAAFGVPESFEPVGAIAVGYAAPDRPSASLKRGRRDPAVVIHRAVW